MTKSTLFPAFILASVMALPLTNALAIKPIGDKGAAAPATAPSQASGKIEKIDLGTQTIVIDGVSYIYQASSVKVNAKGKNASSNPLDLKPGMPIEFKTAKETGSSRLRIVEIWVSNN